MPLSDKRKPHQDLQQAATASALTRSCRSCRQLTSNTPLQKATANPTTKVVMCWMKMPSRSLTACW